MNVTMTPIGVVQTDAVDLPRHWSLSNVDGTLEIYPEFAPGLRDIEAGQKIVVLFHFHKSPPFSEDLLFQTPPHKTEAKGVFSICSPSRPTPIGLSVVEVTAIRGNRIDVCGIDMFDGTPILDIKPHITGTDEGPGSHDGGKAE